MLEEAGEEHNAESPSSYTEADPWETVHETITRMTEIQQRRFHGIQAVKGLPDGKKDPI